MVGKVYSQVGFGWLKQSWPKPKAEVKALFCLARLSHGSSAILPPKRQRQQQIPFGDDKQKGNSRFLPPSTSLRVRNDNKKGCFASGLPFVSGLLDDAAGAVGYEVGEVGYVFAEFAGGDSFADGCYGFSGVEFGGLEEFVGGAEFF